METPDEAACESERRAKKKGVVDKMIIGIGAVLISRANGMGKVVDEISLKYAD